MLLGDRTQTPVTLESPFMIFAHRTLKRSIHCGSSWKARLRACGVRSKLLCSYNIAFESLRSCDQCSAQEIYTQMKKLQKKQVSLKRGDGALEKIWLEFKEYFQDPIYSMS